MKLLWLTRIKTNKISNSLQQMTLCMQTSKKHMLKDCLNNKLHLSYSLNNVHKRKRKYKHKKNKSVFDYTMLNNNWQPIKCLMKKLMIILISHKGWEYSRIKNYHRLIKYITRRKKKHLYWKTKSVRHKNNWRIWWEIIIRLKPTMFNSSLILLLQKFKHLLLSKTWPILKKSRRSKISW